LVAALRRLNTGDRLFVFSKPEDVDRLGPWTGGSEPVPVPLAGRAPRLAWEQLQFPRALRRVGADLVHSPHYTLPLGAKRPIRIVTFHDMIFFLYPKHHKRLKAIFFQRMIRYAACRADHIVADSESTRHDTIRLLGPRVPITTVHLAGNPIFTPIHDRELLDDVCQRYDLRRPFVLTVCTLEPRKNLIGGIRALAELFRSGIRCQLAISGAKGWGYGPILAEASRLGLESDDVRFLGFVPNEDLRLLYCAAAVFLYPSFYEGFGLPPLEAMACGTPVVVSNRSSLPEIVGGAGMLCDPERVDEIAHALAVLLRDEQTRARWGQKALERAREFSWDRTARKTYQVYRAAVRARGSEQAR
jgi:glycosyltransferase involved in cell wall biosynthesis